MKNLRRFGLISLFAFLLPLMTFAESGPLFPFEPISQPINQNPINQPVTFNPSIPFSSSVGSACNTSGILKVICTIKQILNSVLPVLIIVGVLYFVWGIVRYVIGDSEEAKTKGKDGMIYGIIGLAVIIAMWGLVNIVTATLGIDDSNSAAPTKQKINSLLPQ
ncbi:MAG: pilin [bacterium]